MNRNELEMEREKPGVPLAAIIYRALRLARSLLGRRRLLPPLLDALWIARRFAFEEAGGLLGDDFKNRAMGLRDQELERYLRGADTVIDVGCGDGRWTRTASRFARRVLGIDLSTAAVDAAKSRTTQTNVRFMVADAQDDSANLGRFDAGLLIHVLEHVERPVEFLSGLRAVVPLLIVEVPDVESDPLNLARMALDRPFYMDEDHVREYTSTLLEDHLIEAGWSVDEIRCRGGAIVALARCNDSR